MRELMWVGINVDPCDTSTDVEAAIEEERQLLQSYTMVAGRNAVGTTTIYPGLLRVTAYRLPEQEHEVVEVTRGKQVGFGLRVSTYAEGEALLPAVRVWLAANRAARTLPVTVWSLLLPEAPLP